jgi:pimeloyl-ACP methyl ester carboxylesterase
VIGFTLTRLLTRLVRSKSAPPHPPPATNDWKSISQPVLVANGDDDVMVPTSNSFELFARLPKATLAIYPDASHGGSFQYHTDFLRQAISFLAA